MGGALPLITNSVLRRAPTCSMGAGFQKASWAGAVLRRQVAGFPRRQGARPKRISGRARRGSEANNGKAVDRWSGWSGWSVPRMRLCPGQRVVFLRAACPGSYSLAATSFCRERCAAQLPLLSKYGDERRPVLAQPPVHRRCREAALRNGGVLVFAANLAIT